MVAPRIYDHPFIWHWIEQFRNSLPWWRRCLLKLPTEKYKIQQEEFDEWFIKRSLPPKDNQ
uniref:Uncharacterized protein n=1 Tax=uncultured marine virus TaxID=186617 RepID=A0A0F7L699_9VIRU|nr:hypothetical protein [uncultured marine virus]